MPKTKRKTAEERALPGYHIRWMIRRDMPEVLAIEKASFDVPWTEDEIIKMLRQRSVIAQVVECRGEVVGFCIYELQKHRLEIINLAVKPDCRRLGVGRAVIDKLAQKLALKRRNRLCMLVRETNLPAQLFLKAVGFVATAVAQACIVQYSKRLGLPEDALWFESCLIEPGNGGRCEPCEEECEC